MTDDGLHTSPRETRAEEREDRQGGGPSILLSGGDERSEPESLTSSSVRECETDDTRNGTADGRGEAAPAAALPCLSSNNCIGKGVVGYRPPPLSPYRKKSRHRLVTAVEWMVENYGLNCVGLLTLSFGVPGTGRGSLETQELREQAKDLDFVQKRWHSLNTNILSKRYPDWICIPDPFAISDDPKKDAERIIQTRAKTIEILKKAGFGKPHIRWSDGQMAAVVADLKNSQMYIEQEGEVVGKWPILQ